MNNCQKCRKPSEKLTPTSVFIEGRGLHLGTAMCDDCISACKIATEKMMVEKGIPMKAPEPEPGLAGPHPEPRWEQGNYRMDEDEISSFRLTFGETMREKWGYDPATLDIAPLHAQQYQDNFLVRGADLTINGMEITRQQKWHAAQVLMNLRFPLKNPTPQIGTR